MIPAKSFARNGQETDILCQVCRRGTFRETKVEIVDILTGGKIEATITDYILPKDGVFLTRMGRQLFCFRCSTRETV